MEEYRPNSHLSKSEKGEDAPKKKIDKIVKGAVKSKKRSGFAKFASSVIQEDAKNVKNRIIVDVLIPSLKKTISNAVDVILYSGSPSKRGSPASKISYRSYYDEGRERKSQSRMNSGYDYDDVILENRGEAEEVLSRMDDLISTYGTVSVADMYDLVGITGNYTDNKYGWTDIRNASVVRKADGYMIRMPKAMPLN